MQSKKTPQEVVEICEEIFAEHGVAGIVIAQDRVTGYFGVTLMQDGLMRWTDDNKRVNLNLRGATPERLEHEWASLCAMKETLQECEKTIDSLAFLLQDGVKSATRPEPDQKKRYDN